MLADTLAAIAPVDDALAPSVQTRLDALTKPPGSGGRLESLVSRLAAMTGAALPAVTPPGVVVFAADHGVAEEGVSAFPAEVTAQMVANFAAGGAAINVFARQIGARLEVVDVGVKGAVVSEGVVHAKVRPGTANFAREDAMSLVEVERAIEVGIEAAARSHAAGCRCLIVGEMGIANTTASSALLAAISGQPAIRLVGQGTGIAPARLVHKAEVIEAALVARGADPAQPLDLLAKLGGLEIAAMMGAYLGAAARRMPILIDGFIATVAALLGCRLAPELRGYLVFGHRSCEPGHDVALALLDAEPLLDLQMRLGEGTGAALAFPLLEAACRMLSEMATFDSASIDGAS